MTRKKAIEAATARIRDEWRESDYTEYHTEWYEQAASEGYDAGRIAGLREAARISAWWNGEDGAHSTMRDRARELAKKAKRK